MDLKKLKQEDVVASLLKIGEGDWITLYEKRTEGGDDVLVYSALVPEARWPKSLESPDWDLHVGDGMRPVVWSDGAGGGERYEWTPGPDDVLPLVIKRRFDGIFPDSFEILEEFRYFHNLYHDVPRGLYLKVDEDGNGHEVVRCAPQKIELRRYELMQYLQARGMSLAILIDSPRYSELGLKELGAEAVRAEIRGADHHLHLAIDEGGIGARKSVSLLYGKKLIGPPSKEDAIPSPYEKPKKDYQDFIIGTEKGHPVSYICDPEKLADRFGKNKGAPDYLTPVFFRPEVLRKYYGEPQKYTIEDGRLDCAGVWGLRLDNNHKDFVVVYLGDLGTSLPTKEQLYWKSFNVSPEGGVSEVARKRGELAEFADPSKLDLLFKVRFEDFSKRWMDKHGWPLFKELDPQDAHLMGTLRIPLTDNQAELDEQALALAKILVDSLYEKKIAEGLKTLVEGDKGITKLEKFLRERGLAGIEAHIKFLRNLFDLRHGAGHRKGEAYRKAALAFEVDGKGPRRAFEGVLSSALALLDYLSAQLLDSV